MTKAKRRGGEEPDPEIVRLAGIAAGLLAEIFDVDKRELFERPRPSGTLRNVRDLLIGVLHHHFCFNAKTGEVARMSPASVGKNWSLISQQRIAAALGRDRGVVSDAAHEIEDAVNGDTGVSIAVSEITETIANLIAQADAWREALKQEALENAIKARAAEQAHERAVLERVENDVSIEELAVAPKQFRCHQCYGKRVVRVHRLGGDPAYRSAWDAAEAKAPSPSGFHDLTCRFCNGEGVRAASTAGSSAAAILSASQE